MFSSRMGTLWHTVGIICTIHGSSGYSMPGTLKVRKKANQHEYARTGIEDVLLYRKHVSRAVYMHDKSSVLVK